MHIHLRLYFSLQLKKYYLFGVWTLQVSIYGWILKKVMPEGQAGKLFVADEERQAGPQ